MASRSHIRGLNRWESWVEDIPQEVELEVKSLVAETAYRVEADAKRLVPIDTGHLRRSIETAFSDRGLVASVGTNVYYAVYVEFGTSKHHAQPFLIPAFVKHKERFERKLREIMDGVGE